MLTRSQATARRKESVKIAVAKTRAEMAERGDPLGQVVHRLVFEALVRTALIPEGRKGGILTEVLDSLEAEGYSRERSHRRIVVMRDGVRERDRLAAEAREEAEITP